MSIAKCLINSPIRYSEVRARLKYLFFMVPTRVRVHYHTLN